MLVAFMVLEAMEGQDLELVLMELTVMEVLVWKLVVVSTKLAPKEVLV